MLEAVSGEGLTPETMRISRAALLVAASFSLAGCPFAARYGGPPIAPEPADPPQATAVPRAPTVSADAQVAPPKR